MNTSSLKPIYQALVVEDDPTFSEQISHYINQINLFLTPVCCGTAAEAMQVLLSKKIDVMFLDLALPDMDGLDLIRALSNPPIIIVTSCHTERAIDCYDLNVADFLCKPYEYSRFLRGILRSMKPQLASVTVDTPRLAPEQESIFFKSGRRLERFIYDDILFIEAYGIYSKVHTPDGVFAISKRISTLTDELPANQFIRIHKSYFINITHVKRLELKQIWIKANKLPIGITYRPIVHKHLYKLGISAKAS